MYDTAARESGITSTLEGVHVHDHLCMIYETQQEQFDAVVPFMKMGLERGEQCMYIVDENTASEVLDAMDDGGISVGDALESGALLMMSKKETYLKEGYFNSELMFEQVRLIIDDSKSKGYNSLRVAGEMTWTLGDDANVEQLMNYEAKINHFFSENDLLGICQYNRTKFTPEIVLNVIRTHPLVVYGETVCRNHYFVPPDEFLSPNQYSREVERLLQNMLEREQHERAMRESRERERDARLAAEAANRMKDEFLATLSHELRTPLTAIVGWTYLLRSGQLSPEAADHALEVIERNGRAQQKLVGDLLDVSRIITGKLRLNTQQVALAPVIESAIESLRPAAEAKGVRVRLRLAPVGGTVTGDPDRLQQLLWNLFSNAVKFTSGGGRIEVALQRANSHVEILVSDNGEGIRPEFLPHVFDRFRQADQTTTRAHGGLGLGLAIARHIAELHGGTIEASSPGEGQGATFRVKLPVSSERSSNGGGAPSVARAKEATGETERRLEDVRLLIVDDEPDTLEFLTLALEREGASVTAVSSAAEAFASFERERPDVIICDIGMPEEDGYALLKRLRALEAVEDEGRATPAAALTAYTREEDRIQAFLAGFQTHIPKPVNLTELVAAIANLATQRRADSH